MTILSSSAPSLLQHYYRILTGGLEAYGDGAELRPLLSGHLEFHGTLAGDVPDATDGFLQGVTGFIGTVRRINVLREVHDSNGSAVLYDAAMPGGTVRFAEVFTYDDGVISSVYLHYDGQDYLAKGGQ
jgi:hypothetical protein